MAVLTSAFGRNVALALTVLASTGAVVLAADPQPTPRPPTCAERYPDEGPGGVDLRLGCVVSELIGLYTAGQGAEPPRLSSYALGLGAALVLLVVLGLTATRLLARRAGRRLAPVVPGEWWLCPNCKSVNGAQASRCYRCGGPPAGGPPILTEASPVTPQSFGRGKHG